PEVVGQKDRRSLVSALSRRADPDARDRSAMPRWVRRVKDRISAVSAAAAHLDAGAVVAVVDVDVSGVAGYRIASVAAHQLDARLAAVVVEDQLRAVFLQD